MSTVSLPPEMGVGVRRARVWMVYTQWEHVMDEHTPRTMFAAISWDLPRAGCKHLRAASR